MPSEVLALNGAQVRVRVSPIGARIRSLALRDEGAFVNVILASDDDFSGFDGAFMGESIGRFANRIADARVTIDGMPHRLNANEGRHHLHGGDDGFGCRRWQVEAQHEASVRFALQSAAGDQGYPGNLSASAEITVVENGVDIAYSAQTDAPTIVNMTNHNYYNLAQAEGGLAIHHDLTIYADAYLPVDDELIPTGEIASVEGSPFDFRKAARIADRLEQDHAQLRAASGFDHHFIINGKVGQMRSMARLYDPLSRRAMEIRGDSPGLQFYAGHGLDRVMRASGKRFRRYEGICLEPQDFPNAPNCDTFPDTVLRPGDTYRNRIELRFTTGAAA